MCLVHLSISIFLFQWIKLIGWILSLIVVMERKNYISFYTSGYWVDFIFFLVYISTTYNVGDVTHSITFPPLFVRFFKFISLSVRLICLLSVPLAESRWIASVMELCRYLVPQHQGADVHKRSELSFWTYRARYTNCRPRDSRERMNHHICVEVPLVRIPPYGVFRATLLP